MVLSLKGWSVVLDIVVNLGLDNKPMDAENFPFIDQCPKCGYCSFSIEKNVDDRSEQLIRSEKYKEILTTEYANEMRNLSMQCWP